MVVVIENNSMRCFKMNVSMFLMYVSNELDNSLNYMTKSHLLQTSNGTHHKTCVKGLLTEMLRNEAK